MIYTSNMQHVWVIWCVLTMVVYIFVIIAIRIQHNGRGILPIHHPSDQCWNEVDNHLSILQV